MKEKYRGQHRTGEHRDPYGPYIPRHGRGLASRIERDSRPVKR